MFNVKCPHCKNKIAFFERKTLIFKRIFNCKNCHNSVKVNSRSSDLNSTTIGIVVGLVTYYYFDLSLNALIAICIVAVLLFKGLLDMLFSLEKADDDIF